MGTAASAFEVLLYYQFVRVPSPELLRGEQAFLCERLGLRGRIIVADEGINGTLSGPAAATKAYRDFMGRHPLFAQMSFKTDPADGHAFRRLRVRVRPELVALGLPAGQADATRHTAPYLSPQEMRHLMAEPRPDVVLLDARSQFEYDLGHFRGAQPLPIETFRQTPALLEALAPLREKTL
jgi:UPF0176 protein